MRNILFLGFLAISSVAWSGELVSYQGVIVLQTGEVITGEIYIPSFEFVFLVSGQQRVVLPVHKIRQVRFYDNTINVNRKFEVHYYSDGGFSGLTLFETVLAGPIQVLRRPISNRLLVSGSDHAEFRYYYFTQDVIENLSKFHRKLLPKIREEMGDALTEFLRKQDLSTTNSIHAIQIIRFYNNNRSTNQSIAGLR